MEKLQAIVIGCGAIAGRYNEGASVSGTFSHSAAYKNHPGFDIAACVEPNQPRRAAFMDFWQIEQGFSDLDALCNSGIAFDVASICAPTPLHDTLLVDLAGTPVRGVFCEKPMTHNIYRTRTIATAYRKAKLPLAVNYTRRWNPSIRELGMHIQENKFGSLLSGIAIYDRGLLHHGSHMVDLIQMLIGPIQFRQLIATKTGHSEHDPLCDAILTTNAGTPLTLIGIDAGSAGLFELQLVFSKAVVTLEDFSRHIRIRPSIPEPLTRERTRFADGVTTETRWAETLDHAFSEFYDSVCTGAPLSSDSINAISAETICNEIHAAATQPNSSTTKKEANND